MTSAGSRTSDKATQNTPPVVLSISAAATSIASRLFARASRTSERKEADAAVQQREHRLDLVRATDERTRGTSEIRVRDGVERRKPPRAKLEEPGRLCEIFQAVVAEVEHVSVDQPTRLVRQQNLTTMPGSSDSGGSVNLAAYIAFFRAHRRAGVKAHPHLDRRPLERRLCVVRTGDGSNCVRENIEERVALRVHLDTPTTSEDLAKFGAMLDERARIKLFPKLVEQPGRAFNVGEEKRHRPGRKITSRHARPGSIAFHMHSGPVLIDPGLSWAGRRHGIRCVGVRVMNVAARMSGWVD